jgi:hypothetical protein
VGVPVVQAAEAFRAALAGFDPAVISGQDCVAVVAELATVEKACAAARAAAAFKVAACGTQRALGHRDPAGWLAQVCGSTKGRAEQELTTAGAAERCPVTAAALASGELSLEQAREITTTEAECPGSEAELVALARRSSLALLRDEGRRRRLAAADVEVLHRRQHQARRLRHWRDGLGMIRLEAALAPEVGVALVNRLDAECDRLRRSMPPDQRELRAASAADALVALVDGRGTAKASGPELVIVCDVTAWRRGATEPGEVCAIVGGGPVPVAVARDLGRDGFLKAVLHDGRRIDTVAHFGRHIPAELRTALELGAPPDFEGARCVDEGCGRRHGLEWDHLDPVANGGATSFDNLVPRCWPHHRDKTERDRAAGRLGGTGAASGEMRPP